VCAHHFQQVGSALVEVKSENENVVRFRSYVPKDEKLKKLQLPPPAVPDMVSVACPLQNWGAEEIH
jgi:hypothetical protein